MSTNISKENGSSQVQLMYDESRDFIELITAQGF